MKLNAGLDPIIALVGAIGWFIVQALMNRRREADSWDEAERPPAPRPHVPDRQQGIPPQQIPRAGPKATTPPTMRPVILSPQRQNTPRPSPPRIPTPAPIVRTVAPARPVITPQLEGPVGADLAHLKQSQDSYARASHLQQSVAERLTAIDQQTSTHKPAAPKQRARPDMKILEAMRNPVTARQAFVASFVLNPPKALE